MNITAELHAKILSFCEGSAKKVEDVPLYEVFVTSDSLVNSILHDEYPNVVVQGMPNKEGKKEYMHLTRDYSTSRSLKDTYVNIREWRAIPVNLAIAIYESISRGIFCKRLQTLESKETAVIQKIDRINNFKTHDQLAYQALISTLEIYNKELTSIQDEIRTLVDGLSYGLDKEPVPG